MRRIAPILALLACALVAGSARGAEPEQPSALDSFEAAQLRRVLAPVSEIEAKKAQIVWERIGQYVARLKEVEARLASAGNAPASQKIRQEAEAWQNGAPAQEFDAAGQPALEEVATLRAQLVEGLVTLEKQAEDALGAARVKVLAALEQMKVDLARRGRSKASAEIAARAAEYQALVAEAVRAEERKKPMKVPAGVTRERPYTNSLGMKFVPVPGTDVLFCIWETRVRDYAAFAEKNPGAGFPLKEKKYEGEDVCPSENCPIVTVTWDEAHAFCEWLTDEEHIRYRLPTDAEWSAAVGLRNEPGTQPFEKDRKTPGYPWGTDYPPPKGSGNYADQTARAKFPKLPTIDGYDDGHAVTAPVGSYPANEFGIHDLGGNAWEWCEDWYDPGEGKYRVMRGAAWISGVVKPPMNASYRNIVLPDYRDVNYGFRCVISMKPEPR